MGEDYQLDLCIFGFFVCVLTDFLSLYYNQVLLFVRYMSILSYYYIL